MPPPPDPVALLNAWLALEALQPQTFASQEDLLGEAPPRRSRGKTKKAPSPLLVKCDL